MTGNDADPGVHVLNLDLDLESSFRFQSKQMEENL